MIKIDQSLEREVLENEKIFLKNLDHTNIISYNDIFQTSDHFVCFVKQYTQLGNLLQALKAFEGQNYDEQTSKYFIKQVALGVQYLHSKSLFCKNLKIQNIFLTVNGEVKIGG